MNRLSLSLSKLALLLALASALSALQLTAILKAREEMKKVLNGGLDITKDLKSAQKNERILSLVHGTANELNEQMGKRNPSPSARNLTPAKPRFLTQTSASTKTLKREKVEKTSKKVLMNKKGAGFSPRFLKRVTDKDSIVVQYEPAKKENIKSKGKSFFKDEKSVRKLKNTKSNDKKSKAQPSPRKLVSDKKSSKATPSTPARKLQLQAKRAHKNSHIKHHKKHHKKSHKKHHKKHHKKAHRKAHKAHKAHKSRNLKEKKERKLMQLPSVNEFLGNEMKRFNRRGY